MYFFFEVKVERPGPVDTKPSSPFSFVLGGSTVFGWRRPLRHQLHHSPHEWRIVEISTTLHPLLQGKFTVAKCDSSGAYFRSRVSSFSSSSHPPPFFCSFAYFSRLFVYHVNDGLSMKLENSYFPNVITILCDFHDQFVLILAVTFLGYFLQLLEYISEVFPEKVAGLPEENSRTLLSTINLGLSSFGSQVQISP